MQDADQMHKEGFPPSKLSFVKEIRYKHAEKIKTVYSELRKSILRKAEMYKKMLRQ
jgi:hypothetical protein